MLTKKVLADVQLRELEALRLEVVQLRKMVISGFFEEEIPTFRQGYPEHELEDVITATFVTGLVAIVERCRKENQKEI